MKKLLKIRFVKFEKALVAQQLAVVGDEHFDETEHVKLDGGFYLCEGLLSLINRATDERIKIDTNYFRNNTERDEYLAKVVKWISEEQFATDGKLEIGKMCEVSSNGRSWGKSELLAVLPEKYKRRYIVSSFICADAANDWEYARPIVSCGQLKIDGDIYTWEMEVAE